MLKRCIQAENRKLHASPIWGLFFALPLISAIYGTFNYLQNLEILKDGWYSLWTQHTLFYSMFFFPAMVAAYAAYLWRLEHLGHNWNLIMASPVRPIDLFLAKFVVVAKLALLTHLFVFLLYAFCGKNFCTFSGISTDDPACFSSSRCSGSTCGHCGAACAGYGHPKLCHSDLSWAGGRHHRSAGREQRSFSVLALCTDAGRHECKQE